MTLLPEPAVRFEDVTITYGGADSPALSHVDLAIEEGELALVVGRTGSGKSTLLRAINGLVPHFTGGRLEGRVLVAGRDTSTHQPRDLADVVGVVGQDPLAGFVTETVEVELAYGMEQLGLPPDTMRRRVEEVLDVMDIAELRDAPLRDLSGGQQQRVAIGAVLTQDPRVIVLDEPTSALDPTAAADVLAAISRLVHDLSTTVVVAEHRIERVIHHADSIIRVEDGRVEHADPARAMATASVAPPVVRLGRLAGWDPLPLSVRDARRAARPLRRQLADLAPAPPAPARPAGLEAQGVGVAHGRL
uniref:ABC transporter ATP-binding protein n=1 Tax=Janibacter corallicola TaxID=415212 RepID=UPI000A752029